MTRKEKNNSEDLAKTFGKVLRQTRKERGLSQEDLGFESGYHRTYVGLLERGLKSPSLQTIFELARALDLSPAELLGRVDHASRRKSQ